MSTAIPSSFSFEMLSRLPANSFVLVWKELRPDQAPLNNEYQLGANSQRIRFILRGAPNEFLINTNCYLSGNAYLKIKQTDLAAGPQITQADLGVFAANPGAWLKAPIHFFQSSRESFNAGALPYLDNQDIVRSHEYNNLRYACARRNRNQSKTGVHDLMSSFLDKANVLQTSGNVSADWNCEHVRPIRLLYRNAAAAGAPTAIAFGKDLSFQIPLGLYSNMVNSHSIVPIGLTSSYSVNGWQIELETTNVPARCFSSINEFPMAAGGPAPLDANVGVMKDLRIYAPYVRVLDPAVMEAVLSLYQKTESAAVGGVQFPLSLRMNTMAYRFASFPLTQGISDYFFRIVGTDRSVRAYAFWVYNRNRNIQGNWNLGPGQSLCVTRLETSIGTELIHDVIEDTSSTTNNVSNFLAVNGRRSAALFSPLPYYQEGREMQGQQEDDLQRYNMTLNNYALNNGAGGPAVVSNSVCYGVVSLENLDRRESDYSGSFQASGKDLTNVGAIELRMRIQTYAPPAVVVGSNINSLDQFVAGPVPDGNYEILFAYAYDSVFEISPQGVMDVTNAVL